MDKPIKSGKEILDEFFDNITSIPDVDVRIAEKLRELYIMGKLTNTHIANSISKLRDENAGSQN